MITSPNPENRPYLFDLLWPVSEDHASSNVQAQAGSSSVASILGEVDCSEMCFERSEPYDLSRWDHSTTAPKGALSFFPPMSHNEQQESTTECRNQQYVSMRSNDPQTSAPALVNHSRHSLIRTPENTVSPCMLSVFEDYTSDSSPFSGSESHRNESEFIRRLMANELTPYEQPRHSRAEDEISFIRLKSASPRKATGFGFTSGNSSPTIPRAISGRFLEAHTPRKHRKALGTANPRKRKVAFSSPESRVAVRPDWISGYHMEVLSNT